jgi:hypothetical protein
LNSATAFSKFLTTEFHSESPLKNVATVLPEQSVKDGTSKYEIHARVWILHEHESQCKERRPIERQRPDKEGYQAGRYQPEGTARFPVDQAVEK